MFQEIVRESQFMIDRQGVFFCNDTCRIITGEAIDYLLGILNSRLFFFSIKHFYGGGLLGANGVRMKHTFFELFPCAPRNRNIETLVQRLGKHVSNTEEKAIDSAVFNLYSLSEEEIAYIQNN